MEIKDLCSLKDVDVAVCDKSELVDMRDVNINELLTKNEKIEEFLDQIKNPYLFKIGDVAVKVSFNNDCVKLEDRLKTIAYQSF